MSDSPRDPRDDELEELDDVILAQESAVHSPQRRTNVTTDHPSVMISESTRGGAGQSGYGARGASEKTVVIRDRRQLDKMRKAISERQQLKHKKPLVEARTVYLLAAAAVGSLALGTLIAALIDERGEEPLPLTSASAPAPRVAKPVDSALDAPDTIDLDSLPLDRSRRVSR